MNTYKLKAQLSRLLSREREYLEKLEIKRRIESEARFFEELAKMSK